MAYPNEIKDMWELVKESFRSEYSSTAFDLWFNSPVLSQYDPASNEIVFDVESEFKVSKLNEKYRPIIEERFASETGMDVSVVFRFIGTPSNPKDLITRIGADTPAAESVGSNQAEGSVENVMLAKYTFDNFIEGESNHFARAVCLQVAAKPYDVHNPLFIHGPSGVGKTHLMGAVINELRRQNPATRVIYTTGVDFVNHMVKCISHNEMESFRNHYRSCDVLLIDDIQFIAGKESTQNEVFHTFQTLFDEGKQIILASDRPPKDIHPLEERLRSRFEQGLLADINPPNLELRVAIIKKKAEDMSIDLPAEVLSYLAENLRSNIRQLEGAIKKLAAKSLVDGRRISLEMARDCIGDLLGDTEPLNVTIDKIFAAVYKKYNVAKDELVGKRRNKEIANARHIAVYLIREITEISLPNIGKIFDRDHTTILFSYNTMHDKVNLDPLFSVEMNELKKEITG